ncbi:MAG: tetracycline resistance efflux pump [Rhodospirillales bacterium]|jgi:DHA1 family tetracycline resistance protein-like MFS transporter|nr:tetracycline resistance efflux pump [Rhodospirillales bacterium]
MLVLFAIVLTDLIGFGLVVPLLPFYGTHYGASPAEVTQLMATYSLMQLFVAPIWGRLSDRYGRRPILLLSLAGSIVSYLWLGFADALWMLFAARAVQGACAGNIAAAQAYVADITTPETRAKGMGVIGAAFGFGFIIGPAVGGALAGPDPLNPMLTLPAFAGAGLSGLAFLGTLLFLEESLPAESRRSAARVGRLTAIAQALRRPDLRLLISLYFLIIFAFAGMETTFALWAKEQFGWGPSSVGYLFAYVGILGAVIQGGLIGRLTRRFGEERLLLAGTICLLLGMLGIPLASRVPYLFVATGILSIGFAMAQPSIASLISRRAAAHEQGEVLGVSQSAGSLARVVGPLVAGFLFATLGRDAPYFGGALVLACVVILGRQLVRAAGAAPVAKKPDDDHERAAIRRSS